MLSRAGGLKAFWRNINFVRRFVLSASMPMFVNAKRLNGDELVMSIKAGGKQHFIALDAMRGIAALLVGCMHASQLLNSNYYFFHAHLAVDFFFCLSGFVVAYAYDARLKQDMTFADFCVRRLIRLYPMIFVGAGLGGCVMMLGSHGRYAEDALIIAGSFVLMPLGLLFGRQAYPSNNPLWSLFFELFANGAYAAISRVSTIALKLSLVPAAALLLWLSVANNGLLEVGFSDPASFMAGFVRVAYPFAAGVLVCRLGIDRQIKRATALPAIAILIATLLLPHMIGGWIDGAIVILVFPIVVLMGVGNAPARISPLLKILGEVSYPFYVIHQPIIRAVKNMPFAAHVAEINIYILPAFCIGIGMAASYFLFWMFDKPARAFLTEMLVNPPNQLLAVRRKQV